MIRKYLWGFIKVIKGPFDLRRVVRIGLPKFYIEVIFRRKNLTNEEIITMVNSGTQKEIR